MSLKFRYKITIKTLFSKEKSTYSIFLAIILPTYSVSNTTNMPTYSIFNAINESTYSVLSFISWRNLNIFARLRQVTNYFEASAMSAARSSSLMFLPPQGTPSKPPWRFTNEVVFFSRWHDASVLRPVPLVCILGLPMITFLRSQENTL